MIELHKSRTHWQVTLNRPDKANALTDDMLSTLHAIFIDAADASELRSLVISGRGERVFCGGADLQQASTRENPRTAIWDEMANALAAVPALTIAMINGHCIGGGLVLALSCDLRISVTGSQFAYPALRMGALPGELDGQRLRQLIGSARAAMLLLGDARITAGEALQWGLVERVVTRNELNSHVEALCLSAREAERDHLQKMIPLCWSSKILGCSRF